MGGKPAKLLKMGYVSNKMPWNGKINMEAKITNF